MTKYIDKEIELIAREIKFENYSEGDFSDELYEDRERVINEFDNVIFNYTRSMSTLEAKTFRQKIFGYLGIEL